MGVYDTYGDVQIKIGDVSMAEYSIGDEVPLKDGIYFDSNACIVIQNRRFIAQMPIGSVYSKWGHTIDLLPAIEKLHPLRLPEKTKIAFDVDDTLIVPAVATGSPIDTPNYDTISLYRWFQKQGYYMIVWSGSGIDWATRWSEKLGLFPDEIREKKKSSDVAIAFDDCEVDLAQVNIRVKRLNNSVSRKEWNETKRST